VDARGQAFGRRLHVLRTSAGLDPTELAVAAGLDPVMYRLAEAGDPDTLTYLDLVALADALAVPPASLLGDLT
jgi:transcriptional regulator with XRE-family HTH domain